MTLLINIMLLGTSTLFQGLNAFVKYQHNFALTLLGSFPLKGWQLRCVSGEEDPDEAGEPSEAVDEPQDAGGGGGGGDNAAPEGRRPCETEESRHQVLLMVQPAKKKYPTQIRCSGSLIDRTWVLTAASCDHP